MPRRIRLWMSAALALAATAGLLAYGAAGRLVHDAAPEAGLLTKIWTCPMHPEVRDPAPGRCPTCGMDLELESDLLSGAGQTAGHDQHGGAAVSTPAPRGAVELDTRRRQLTGVRTAVVARGEIARDIRAVGLVRYDETKVADVNLKLDGWVRTLHVNSTGQPVRRGQPLLEIYSQDLLATQNEYLLAMTTRDSMRSSQVQDARIQAERLVESARQRLALWDLPAEELAALDRQRTADGRVTFRSPVSGHVIDKPVVAGMRVMPGQTLYRIADLSTVWVEADIHESDAPFVRAGATAVVSLDAWPGESLRGRVSLVYPFVEEQTRTLRVRFAFANPKLRLKPGMFANVQMSASLGDGLVIPADALLDAGREQFVFVAEGEGYYQPRPVRAGRRLGDRVQVLEGLRAGERVATGATFFLDSESQLRSAMAGWEAAPTIDGHTPAAALEIAFATRPSPPRSGENAYEVRVTDEARRPVTDAQVTVLLYMPPMPSMNMPAMSSEAKLVHEAGGVYRGKGLVSMPGRWDVTITVTRDGQRLGSRQTTIVAR